MGIAFLHKDKYSIKKGKTTPPDFYIDPLFRQLHCRSYLQSEEEEKNILYIPFLFCNFSYQTRFKVMERLLFLFNSFSVIAGAFIVIFFEAFGKIRRSRETCIISNF